MDNGPHSMQSLERCSNFLITGSCMQFKGRSLYNLLKISLKEDPTIQTEPWQVQDYRKLSDEDLLKNLKKLGISLTKESFLIYVENCDTPEELLECLWVNEDDLIGQDKTYLNIFEMWRRWAPEHQSLSIFCDELDELILLYDEGQLEDDEPLQKTLGELQDILDQGVDQGIQAQEIFQTVMGYMAHDVEQFLYDYILDLMEASNELYASELVDSMSAYVSERKWLDLLKVRLFALSNSPETFVFAARLLEQAEDEKDLIFLMEFANFLIQIEEDSLFLECMKWILPLIQTKEDLLEALGLVLDFFRYLDKEPSALKVEQYIEKKEKDSGELVTASDISAVNKLLLEL
jgi:hypothetical protein